MSGNLHVALGVRHFDVALAGIDGDVSGGVAHLNVSPGRTDNHRLVHVGHGHIAALAANVERSFFRHRNVQIQAGARIAAGIHGTNFVAVAVLGDFNGNSGGQSLCLCLAPSLDALLAIDADLRFIGGVYADVAATVANRDAGICKNGKRFHVKVKIESVTPSGELIDRKLVLDEVDARDSAKQAKKSQNQENLPGRDRRSARLAGTAGHGAFIELNRAPKDNEQRPPIAKQVADIQAAIVVHQKKQADKQQSETGKERFARWAGIGHREL